jgi:hypothetical protein
MFKEVERGLVQVWTTKLLDVKLVELSMGEYVLIKIMLAKKNILSNWIECHMCKDYNLVIK